MLEVMRLRRGHENVGGRGRETRREGGCRGRLRAWQEEEWGFSEWSRDGGRTRVLQEEGG